MTTVEAPEHAGSREQARKLLSKLPQRLSGISVVLDCKNLAVSTPSFLDEIVRQVLVERSADQLNVIDADERARDHVVRSADNRKVRAKLTVTLRVG
jgi:hypothetical protein